MTREDVKLEENTYNTKDCLTCGNNDADVCRSCVAKAVGKNDYPLWESKDE